MGELARKATILNLFSTEAKDVLAGLYLPSGPEDVDILNSEWSIDLNRSVSPVANHVVPEKKACSFCKVEFLTRTEQKNHFKSDWHLFNLRRKVKGIASVTEDQFDNLVSEVSSISGSDQSDSEEESHPEAGRVKSPLPRQLERLRRRRSSSTDSDSSDSSVQSERSHTPNRRKHPKVFFKNSKGDLLSVYRCVLYGKVKNPPEDGAELAKIIKNYQSSAKWCILMTGGGHFAGAMFDRDTILVHKTFHRYVVRAKRGSAQSVRDSQGNAPKSAGASLRRHNEAALTQEIQDLLESWSEHINSCMAIFIRAPTYNRGIFFKGKKSPIRRGDERIRTMPFPTRRATFSEVKRVQSVLSSVEIYGPNLEVKDVVFTPPRKAFDKPDQNRSTSQERCPSRQLKPAARHLASDAESLSSSSTAGSDVELETCHVTLYTDGLKEFDCTKPRRRGGRGKKKTSISGTKAAATCTSGYDTTLKNLKDKFYTVCKTGNKEALSTLLWTMNWRDFSHMSLDSDDLSVTKIGYSFPDTIEDKGDHVLDDKDTSTQINNEAIFDESQSSLSTDKGGVDTTVNSFMASNCIQPVSDISQSHSNARSNVQRTVSASDVRSNSFELGSNISLIQPNVKDTVQSSKAVEGSTNINLKAHVLNDALTSSGDTLLHIVAVNGHSQLISVLLDSGADPCSRNKKGQTPYVVSKDKVTRNEFRRFRAQHSSLHDYDKAQIPPPITEEQENAKKQREAEKRKAQKKAKREKQKAQKEEEAKKADEEREKQRFLKLSDREKRALAAERRIAQQAQSQGEVTPVLSRCYQCAVNMTGKVPFEYFDFKFCTTKCLREHKAKVATEVL